MHNNLKALWLKFKSTLLHKRSLYGLKQSSRYWNQVLHTQLMEMGFKQTSSDPCIYTSL